MSKVTVYHGTTKDFLFYIRAYGLKSARQNGYVYVTTDIETAKKYAWAWTGGRLYEADKAGHIVPNDYVSNQGVIIKFKVDKEKLEVDDYNIEAEPYQYKVYKKITPGKIMDWDIIDFPEFKDKDKWLFARAFLVGVMRE